MRLTTYTLAERPELGQAGWRALDGEWPAFMHLAPTGVFYRLAAFDDYVLIGVTEADQNSVVARAASVPFRLPRTAGGPRAELPDDGWDEVLRWAADDLLAGRTPDTVASLEVVVRRDLRHRAWGAQMITALKDNARRLGFRTLVAPVRPVAKHREPHTPMTAYVARTRADGLPADPWLRAHARLGGRIVKIAPASTVIPLSLAAWRDSTGLAFDRSGLTDVPDALVPVHTSVEHGYGVYVEPAVWMQHDL